MTECLANIGYAVYIAAFRHCYSLELAPQSFDDARADCHNKGGILAEPPIDERDDFITALKTDATLKTGIGNLN